MVNMPLLKVRKLNQYQRLEWTFKNELIKLNQSFFSVLVLQSTSVQSPRVCLRFQTQGFSPPTGQGEQPQLLRSRCPCRIYDAPLALSLESHTHPFALCMIPWIPSLDFSSELSYLSLKRKRAGAELACLRGCPCVPATAINPDGAHGAAPVKDSGWQVHGLGSVKISSGRGTSHISI